jgi:hypothetical protein
VASAACQARRKDDQPCRARVLPGESWCWAHHPDRQEIAAAARSNGAVKANKLRSLEGGRRKLDTPRAVVAFLSNLVHDVAEGRRDAEVAKVIAYTVNVQLKAVELVQKSEVERRLSALEERVARQPRKGGRQWA